MHVCLVVKEVDLSSGLMIEYFVMLALRRENGPHVEAVFVNKLGKLQVS